MSVIKKILIVEDEANLRAIYKEAIENHDATMTVELAENGLVALDKVGKKTYDLIVMDIEMPLMNGIEAAKEIRKMGYRKPIVAHTSIGVREAEEAIVQGIMDGFSLKSGIDNLLNLVQAY